MRKQKAEQVECDCSCKALDDLTNRGRGLEKQMAAGRSVSNEDILQLSAMCFGLPEGNVSLCHEEIEH